MGKSQKDNDNTDRYIDPKDFHTLLSESVRQERSDRLYKISSLLLTALTPLTIGAGTWILTLQQINSAREIANSNIQSAETTAEANREQSRNIADSNQKIEQLGHINKVFQKIINPREKQETDEVIQTLKMEISSLEAYGDYSLSFLVNIAKHFKNKPGYLDLFAMESVRKILSKNQLDLTGQTFVENGGEDKLNLRQKSFLEFNLSKGQFINVNLYKADFTQSTLKYTKFERSDLYETIFTGCNLKGTIFTECDLRKSNFEQAKIEKVEFKQCKLKGSKFTLGSLVKVDELPFNKLIQEKKPKKSKGRSGKDKYLNLLLPHLDDIKKNGSKNDEIQKVVKILKMKYPAFIDKLTTLKHKQETEYSNDKKKPYPSTNSNKIVAANQP